MTAVNEKGRQNFEARDGWGEVGGHSGTSVLVDTGLHLKLL